MKNYRSFINERAEVIENALTFYDTDAYSKIIEKHQIPKKKISEYFHDLSDDGVVVSTYSFLRDGVLSSRIGFKRKPNSEIVINPKAFKVIHTHLNISGEVEDMKVLSKVYKDYSDYITLVNTSLKRFAEEELYEIDNITHRIPEYENLVRDDIIIDTKLIKILSKEEESEIKNAIDKFNNTKNINRIGWNTIVDRMKKDGVKDPEEYLTASPEYKSDEIDYVAVAAMDEYDGLLMVGIIDKGDGSVTWEREYRKAVEMIKRQQ